MSDSVIVECPICELKVSARILTTRRYPPGENYDPFKVYFLECPICTQTMVGHSDLVQVGVDEWVYEKPTRLWPEPRKNLDWSIPSLVRKSIEEAGLCYKAKAYSACAVMCGRTIEALCLEHSIEDWQLSKGLKKLKEKGIIDGRLLEWGEALRERRNIGAHATEEEISLEDAKDLLDFTEAICEYVYVLLRSLTNSKFEKRKGKVRVDKNRGEYVGN